MTKENALDAWGYLSADESVLRKAAGVRWILTDCDGCLTDGGVYYGENGEVLKRFSIVDGMGVTRLRARGFSVGIVTGERSASIVARAAKLGIEEVHLGVSDKGACLEAFRARLGLPPEAIAFFGDDVNDLSVVPQVGLFGAPANVLPDVRPVAHWVSPRGGGLGAFRDFAELVLRANG
jgi:3-deoxy-D-manno-octulosonate 8-phosphate phosphatase (KDO 8-P phosphatase)